jgi:subtilisin-like proprotein convertase family protein
MKYDDEVNLKEWRISRCICLLMLVLCTFAARGQTFSSGPVNTPIPNNLTALYLPLAVSGLPESTNPSFGLESLCLDLVHTSCNNLEIYLNAPDGTSMAIATKNGGTADNYTGACFRMDAPVHVMKGTAPFTGTFRPQGDFGAVNGGQNPNGQWGLIIIDVFPGDADSGSVTGWSLSFGDKPGKPLSFSSNLPILHISTNGQSIDDNPKKMMDLGIIWNGPGKRNELHGPRTFEGKIGIEIRGSSSQQFPKKSFSFETLDAEGQEMDTSLLGLPAEHDWVLHAPYSDKTLIRNALTYKLYSEMGHYSPRFRFVELVINRQYQGVYLLVEKIKRDRHRVNIAKLGRGNTSGGSLTGGYIVKIDRVNGKGGAGWYSKHMSNSHKIYFQYEYPRQDSIQPAQKAYIESYMDTLENVLMSPSFSDPVQGYRRYMDVSSFVDNFLLNELSKNTDGYRLSTFLYKNRCTKGGKLVYGPAWDFDLAWYNVNANGGNDPAGWQYQMLNEDFEIPFWWNRLMSDTLFTNDLYCRYTGHRKQCLALEKINACIDSLTGVLQEAQARNFAQWPTLGVQVFYEPAPVAVSYREEISNLKSWIKSRLSWMDASISGTCPRNPDTQGSERTHVPPLRSE